MKHLDVLAGAGLVLSRKKGRQRWHYVNLAPLMTLHERWSTPISEGLAAGLLAVKDQVEGPMGADLTTLDLQFEVEMAAPPSTVYAAITERPGGWWGPPYLRADASALSFEVIVGGQLIEHWDGGGQVLATVTGLTTDRWIHLTGPFHLGNAVATADFALSGDASSTVVRMGFTAYGLIPEELADGFRAAWTDLIGNRLKRFVEDGELAGLDAG